jgi:hypothetical protein
VAQPLRYTSTIKKSGPFFTGDPVKTLETNIHDMMLKIAREGQKDVRGQLLVGDAARDPISRLSNAHVSHYVSGELRRFPQGPRYSARIIVRNRKLTREQGTALYAAASVLEGRWHAFQKTTRRILRAINGVDLTKGMN